MPIEIEAVADSALDGVTLGRETALRMPDKSENSRKITAPFSMMAIPELVFFLVAGFRRHPHINNVFTHISCSNWSRIDQALCVIVDPDANSRDLSPLAKNIIDLICADRGVTGRIVKPYYRQLLVVALGEEVASRLVDHATCLFLESEVAARGSVSQPAAPGPLTGEMGQ